MIKISIIIPCYNEENRLPSTLSKIEMWLQGQTIFDVELILSNDGSKDKSLSLLKKLKRKCKALKIVDLSRNFGQHSALSCGYKLAKGKYIIRNNIDMQDPLIEVPKLLNILKSSNSEIVIGTYRKRKSNFFVKLTSYLYFMILSNHFISSIEL